MDRNILDALGSYNLDGDSRRSGGGGSANPIPSRPVCKEVSPKSTLGIKFFTLDTRLPTFPLTNGTTVGNPLEQLGLIMEVGLVIGPDSSSGGLWLNKLLLEQIAQKEEWFEEFLTVFDIFCKG